MSRGVEDLAYSLRHALLLLGELGVGAVPRVSGEFLGDGGYEYYREHVGELVGKHGVVVLWGVPENSAGDFERMSEGDRIIFYATKGEGGAGVYGYVIHGTVLKKLEGRSVRPYWPSDAGNVSKYPYRFLVRVEGVDPRVWANPSDPSRWRGLLAFPYKMSKPRRSLTAFESDAEFAFLVRSLHRFAGWIRVDLLIGGFRFGSVLAEEGLVVGDDDSHVVNKIASLLAREDCRALLFEGPPGSGKTVLARCAARALGYELIEVACHEHLTRYDLVGGYTLTGGELRWRPGVFVEALAACRGRGAVLLLDEVNRARVERVLGEVFSALGSGDFRVPTGLIRELRRGAGSCTGDCREVVESALKVLEENG